MILFYKTPLHYVGYSQLLIFGVVLGAIIQFVDCPDRVFLLPLLLCALRLKRKRERKDPVLTIWPLVGFSDGRSGEKRC